MRVLAILTRIVLGLIIALLWIRFAIKLFGIEWASPIMVWTLKTSDMFLLPFGHMFSPIVIGGTYVIETLTLFAIVIYELVKFILVKLFHFINRD